MNQYEMTIGIECHVQLATNTKLFSSADNDARGKEPNSVVSPVDYGLPGMLPVLNRQAVTLAVRAAKALNADVAKVSRFDRKHYFYPDLPKGYQTTQMYHPIILSGYVDAPLDDGSSIRVRIHHAHMEEDAGKLSHKEDASYVDLNRAGTPLIEIVSEPDMHSASAARAYATELYRLMTYAGVTFGDLYHGNMRFDVNISVAPAGSTILGNRAEVKNLNSFRSVEKAAEYEYSRQVELLSRGETVMQETRGWDESTQRTYSQRSKEDAQDYRYMPDADIPPIVLSSEEIEAMQRDVGTMPHEYRELFSKLGMQVSVANTLLMNREHAQTVAAASEHGKEHSIRIGNWFASVFKPSDSGHDVAASDVAVVVDDLVTLSKMVETATLSSTNAKEIFLALASGERDPERIARDRGLLQMGDENEIGGIVDTVLADPASQKAVEDIRAGNEKAIGYLVGQVMKASKGQANPGLAQKLIKDRL